MLDPKELRTNLTMVAAQLQRRGFTLDVAAFRQLEEKRATLQQHLQALQMQRNRAAKAIGMAKSQGQKTTASMQAVAELGDELKQTQAELTQIQQRLWDLQLMIPNVPQASVPDGANEADNREISTWGEIPQFSFIAKDHVTLGERMGLIDLSAGTKLAGARFVVLRAQVARLQRALAQFMLDLHTEQHGYCEVDVPYLVHADCLLGSGQLPKFHADLFTVAGEWDLALIPTAEVPLVNLARDEIIPADQLPLKLVAHTPSFRSEAGSYGKDTRGMIRQHQFHKVELVQLVKPADADATLAEMTEHAQKVLQLLQLPYRVVELCAGDLGFSATKTYDLEVWLPGQNCYREIASCSHCGDFQARRMRARWRPSTGAKPELLHTLNASGLAVGRTLVAVLENYQLADGTIKIPTVLRRYMPDCEYI